MVAQRETLTPDTAWQTLSKIGILEIKNTGNVEQLGTNWTLYGPGGAGKTTLPAGLHDTEYGPVLYGAAESGLIVIKHLGIPYVDIARWSDAEAMLNAFKSATPPPYKSVVLDNLSEMAQLAVYSEAPDGMPTQPQWNKITNKMLHIVREWRDLTKIRDLNVFFLAWDADERDEVGTVKKDINFTPALRKAYPGIVDTVGHLSTPQNKPDMRRLSFEPGPKTIAKFRRAPTSNSMQVPFNIYYGLNNLPMYDVIATIKGDKPWPAEKYPVPTSA